MYYLCINLTLIPNILIYIQDAGNYIDTSNTVLCAWAKFCHLIFRFCAKLLFTRGQHIQNASMQNLTTLKYPGKCWFLELRILLFLWTCMFLFSRRKMLDSDRCLLVAYLLEESLVFIAGAADRGRRSWPQIMAADHGRRSWPQIMAALHARRSWPQIVAADRGRRSWPQIVWAADRGRRSWPQIMAADRGRRSFELQILVEMVSK